MTNIIDILNKSDSNAWIKASGLSIYVRNTQHLLNNKLYHCFDIANVTAISRGKGRYTRFLIKLEKELQHFPIEAIYIENIYELRFQLFHKKQGFQSAQEPWAAETSPLCMFKILS